MKVTIEAIGTADLWHLTGIVKLRIYANQSFINSDGQFVPQGIVGSSATAYLEVDCTVVANVLTIPAIEIDSTVDALTNIYATYTAEFVASGRRVPYLTNFAVNTLEDGDDSTTWGEIVLLRDMLSPQSIPDSLTRQLIANIQLAVGGLNKSSSTNTGVTALTVDPVNPAFPVAVGANDPAFLAAMGGGGGTAFKSSDYASLAAAVTAIGATPGALRIQAADFPSGASVTVPPTLVLDFGDVGTLALTTGHTVTIQSDTADYPRRNLWTNALAGQGIISFAGSANVADFYLEWWGGAADSATDNFGPATAALEAYDTVDGGTIRLLAGQYNFSMSPNWMRTGIAIVGSPGTHIKHTGTGDAFLMSSGQPAVLWLHRMRVEEFTIVGNFADLTGVATANNGTTAVVGAGTAFLSEVAVGDAISFEFGMNTESRLVTAIADDTHLTVDNNWTLSYIGATMRVGKTRYGMELIGIRNAIFRHVSVKEVAHAPVHTTNLVTNTFETFVCSYHEPTQNIGFVIRPQYMVVLDNDTTTQTFTEPVWEGAQIFGGWFKPGCYGNTLINGTSEGNKGGGIRIDSIGNVIINTDFEANGDTDILINQSRNTLINVVAAGETIVNAGQGNLILGGDFGDLIINADNTKLDGPLINGTFIDNTPDSTHKTRWLETLTPGVFRQDSHLGNVVHRHVALLSSANIDTNARNANIFSIPLAHNATLANPTNARNAQVIYYRIEQTAAFTLTFGSKFRVPSSKAFPVMSTVVGEKLYIAVRYDATNDIFDIVSANSEVFNIIQAAEADVTGVYSIDGIQVVGNQQPAIVDPTGGAVIDVQARAALTSLLAASRSHGLIAVTPPFDPDFAYAWFRANELHYENGELMNKFRELLFARSLLQGDIAQRPTFVTNQVNGRACARFNGAAAKMTTAPFAYNQPVNVSLVIKRFNNAFGYLFSSLTDAGVALLQGDGASNDQVAMFAGTGSGDPSGVIDSGVWHLVTCEYDGASSKIYENTVLVNAGNPGVLNGNGLLVGNRFNGQLPTQFDLAELVIYQPSIRADVETWLMGDYGL